MAFCDGGYTTNLPVEDLLEGKALVVWEYGGEPLEPEHGGPARLLAPHLYFWKSAQRLRGLRFMEDRDPRLPQVLRPLAGAALRHPAQLPRQRRDALHEDALHGVGGPELRLHRLGDEAQFLRVLARQQRGLGSQAVLEGVIWKSWPCPPQCGGR
jgi:DMSO/TMAO reductase YedYZ molybdopterin-dependent catalytic subunit